MGLGTSAYTLVLAWLPPFYIDLGEPRATAGYLLSGMTGAEVMAGLMVSMTIGRFPDRRGPILTALVLALLGLAGLVIAPISLAVPVVLVLGLGIGAIFPLSLILAMDQIDDPARRATCSPSSRAADTSSPACRRWPPACCATTWPT